MSVADEDMTCECSHNEGGINGLALSSFSSCCEHKTIELNNINSFIKSSENQLTKNISYITVSSDELSVDLSAVFAYSFLKGIFKYYPDIPISNSSLLI